MYSLVRLILSEVARYFLMYLITIRSEQETEGNRKHSLSDEMKFERIRMHWQDKRNRYKGKGNRYRYKGYKGKEIDRKAG